MQKRALLSVSDKSGLPELADKLHKLGYEILSTGGTERALREQKIPVTSVEDVTHFPECFSGRVKTMHPLIMGGVLFRRDDPQHQKEAKQHGIKPIDIVVVNLYPFAATLKKPAVTEQEIIENIDIGGPTLLRSAAKNFENVTVVCDPKDYASLIEEIERDGSISALHRKELAAKAFLHTCAYDALIMEHLSLGANAGIVLSTGRSLRYGENPHQWGKFFSFLGAGNSEKSPEESWGRLLQGKTLSYLNILDADGAWNAVCEFLDPTAVLVKHATPSGIASHSDITEAFQRAYDADRLSAFGVIIALNRPCTGKIVRRIIDNKIFTEVIVAPSYEEEALELLKQKPNIRVIVQRNGVAMKEQIQYRSVLGGMLVQQQDTRVLTESDLTCVTKRKPTAAETRDLLFAWKAVKSAKSNAIVFAKDCVTIGIGSGQTSRVDSTWIAAKRAGEKSKGAVMASDAFFPFPDSIEEASSHGIIAVVQPGGSIRDTDVFKRADELGMTMVTTGIRAFRH